LHRIVHDDIQDTFFSGNKLWFFRSRSLPSCRFIILQIAQNALFPNPFYEAAQCLMGTAKFSLKPPKACFGVVIGSRFALQSSVINIPPVEVKKWFLSSAFQLLTNIIFFKISHQFIQRRVNMVLKSFGGRRHIFRRHKSYCYQHANLFVDCAIIFIA